MLIQSMSSSINLCGSMWCDTTRSIVPHNRAFMHRRRWTWLPRIYWPRKWHHSLSCEWRRTLRRRIALRWCYRWALIILILIKLRRGSIKHWRSNTRVCDWLIPQWCQIRRFRQPKSACTFSIHIHSSEGSDIVLITAISILLPHIFIHALSKGLKFWLILHCKIWLMVNMIKLAPRSRFFSLPFQPQKALELTLLIYCKHSSRMLLTQLMAVTLRPIRRLSQKCLQLWIGNCLVKLIIDLARYYFANLIQLLLRSLIPLL